MRTPFHLRSVIQQSIIEQVTRIRRMTIMTSFPITFYGQCCRRHVVGQRIVGDVSVVRIVVELFVACVLNLTILCSYACSLMLYLEGLFCFKHQTQLVLQYGGVYLVTIDIEISDLTAPYLHLLF